MSRPGPEPDVVAEELDRVVPVVRRPAAEGVQVVAAKISPYAGVLTAWFVSQMGSFGAVFLPSSGPGLIPFDAESADGLPKHRQLTQEFRVESNASAIGARS